MEKAMRNIKFNTIVSFRNLLEKNMSKDARKPLKTAKEVMMLVDAILYDAMSFEHFYNFGDDVNVWVSVDDKRKITNIKVGEK